MEIEFLTRPTDEEWRTCETWQDAQCIPRKGELVTVTETITGGARVRREMRVLEVCHAGPRNARIWLVPTYVKV